MTKSSQVKSLSLSDLDTESDFWQARSSLIATDTSGGDIATPPTICPTTPLR
jgi:hypothetical protein